MALACGRMIVRGQMKKITQILSLHDWSEIVSSLRVTVDRSQQKLVRNKKVKTQ